MNGGFGTELQLPDLPPGLLPNHHYAHELAPPSSGGGRKISRVEVSLDGGHLWRQAEITRHETPTPAGE